MKHRARRLTGVALGLVASACSTPEPTTGRAPNAGATPAPVVATVGQRDLPDTVYKVEWVGVEGPRQLQPGESGTFKVTLKNVSPVRWPGGAGTLGREYTIRLGPRWLKPVPGDRPMVVSKELRAELPNVDPGETVALEVSLVAPEKPGPYDVQFDLVYENVAWFSTKGAATKLVPVKVG